MDDRQDETEAVAVLDQLALTTGRRQTSAVSPSGGRRLQRRDVPTPPAEEVSSGVLDLLRSEARGEAALPVPVEGVEQANLIKRAMSRVIKEMEHEGESCRLRGESEEHAFAKQFVVAARYGSKSWLVRAGKARFVQGRGGKHRFVPLHPDFTDPTGEREYLPGRFATYCADSIVLPDVMAELPAATLEQLARRVCVFRFHVHVYSVNKNNQYSGPKDHVEVRPIMKFAVRVPDKDGVLQIPQYGVYNTDNQGRMTFRPESCVHYFAAPPPEPVSKRGATSSSSARAPSKKWRGLDLFPNVPRAPRSKCSCERFEVEPQPPQSPATLTHAETEAAEYAATEVGFYLAQLGLQKFQSIFYSEDLTSLDHLRYMTFERLKTIGVTLGPAAAVMHVPTLNKALALAGYQELQPEDEAFQAAPRR